MTRISACSCPLCSLEQSLLAQLGEPRSLETYRRLSAHSAALSAFAAPIEVLAQLHDRPPIEQADPRRDQLLGELIRVCVGDQADIVRPLLLLILMPAVHKTCRQVAAVFPFLDRDDIAQQLLAVLLEAARSEALRIGGSHFAFTLVRRLRRSAFRWAIREARHAPRTQAGEAGAAEPITGTSDLEAPVLLRAFLQQCVAHQVLTEEECTLLLLAKLHGVPWEFLHAGESVSAVALKHRLQRVIARLRRAAFETPLKKRPARVEDSVADSRRISRPRPAA